MQGYDITSLSAKTQELIKNEGLNTNNEGRINKNNGELAELLSRTGKSDINELCQGGWLSAKAGDLAMGTGVILGSGILGYSANRMGKSSPAELKFLAKNYYESLNPPKLTPKSLEIPVPVKPSRETNAYYENLKSFTNLETAEKYWKDVEPLEQDKYRRLMENYKIDIEEIKAHNKKCAEWKEAVSMKECIKKASKSINVKRFVAAGILGICALASAGIGAYFIAKKPE